MSADTKRGYGSTIILMILGVLAPYVGGQWLMVIIPVALLVRYAFSSTSLWRSRN
jgi:hypothetical protein